jgi:hypothetical protein
MFLYIYIGELDLNDVLNLIYLLVNYNKYNTPFYLVILPIKDITNLVLSKSWNPKYFY